jgi:hypothetical protein
VIFVEDTIGLTLANHIQESQNGSVEMTIVRSLVGAALASRTIKVSSNTLLCIKCSYLKFNSILMARFIQQGDILMAVNGMQLCDFEFEKVLQILKGSSRPIHMRFRRTGSDVLVRNVGVTQRQNLYLDYDYKTTSVHGSSDQSSIDDLTSQIAEDVDSQLAVNSESFGEANSTRTTENSSVITEIPDIEYPMIQHQHSPAPSRLSQFLRKPFGRSDSSGNLRSESLYGNLHIPPPPRCEIVLYSPLKASIRVVWPIYSNRTSYQLQYSRDWTMRVWKNWSGRITRTLFNEDQEFCALVYGLDHCKSYVFRIRYKLEGSIGWGEWSHASRPIYTREASTLETTRAERRTNHTQLQQPYTHQVTSTIVSNVPPPSNLPSTFSFDVFPVLCPNDSYQTNNTLKVVWRHPSSCTAIYHVEVNDNEDNVDQPQSWQEWSQPILSPEANRSSTSSHILMSYVIGGLSKTKEYRVRLRVQDSSGQRNFFTSISNAMKPGAQLPLPTSPSMSCQAEAAASIGTLDSENEQDHDSFFF